MEKNRRKLLVTIILLVVVLVGAYFIYQAVMSRSSGPSASYVPQLTLPAGMPAENTPAQSNVTSGTTTPAAQESSEVPADAATVPVDHDAAAVSGQASAMEEASATAVIEEPIAEPKVPDLPLNMLDGTVTSFDAARNGKPAVLLFWATWCPSCKLEIPVMQKAWEEMGDEISFMLLSTPDGQRETVEAIKSYVEKNNVTAPVYWDNGLFAYIFGANAIPSTVFINADGTVSHGYMGYIPEAAMLNEIRGMLQ